MKIETRPTKRPPDVIERIHVRIKGMVQGVGFRPFIYRLAKELGLTGWVYNGAQGIELEAEGSRRRLESFLWHIQKDAPSNTFVQNLEWAAVPRAQDLDFHIRSSEHKGQKTAQVLPDLGTCPDCLRDIFDKANPRHCYPFTNCTRCGPRFSIIKSLPYDRAHTTMHAYKMCPKCQEEYNDPLSRRFHAQPNACPKCGPHLMLWDKKGKTLGTRQQALRQAVKAIDTGHILAVKGLGGFQLMADAGNTQAVKELRKRKHREEKPFAVMFPSLDAVKQECHVTSQEKQLLLSPAAPIVLLERQTKKTRLSPDISPDNPYIGVMLPYTPLHALLLNDLGIPVVCTSGNLTDEPICIDEHEALKRLKNIADLFLVHNRAIVRHMDDSVVKVICERPLIMRSARGYAPLIIPLHKNTAPSLSVGAHLKNTVAVTAGQNIVISQHIGDLNTPQSLKAFCQAEESLRKLYEVQLTHVVCDAHPDYFSTRYAEQLGLPCIKVQHHHAHIAACLAEHGIEEKVLGIAWDGTGYGTDNTIWGGEFLLADCTDFKRTAHFKTFPLPGAEKSVREPRRTALGLLYEIFGQKIFDRTDIPTLQSFTKKELTIIQTMLKKGLNTPRTSSAGRLFDVVASLIGLKQKAGYEGQAPMLLEHALHSHPTHETYPWDTEQRAKGKETNDRDEPLIINWHPMIHEILRDTQNKIPIGLISAKFHNTLIDIIVAMAQKTKNKKIILSGGCFQNKYLLENAVLKLRQKGYWPYWPNKIPPNDNSISLGQAVVAAAIKK